MKVASKKLFAFVLSICMFGAICTQSASAAEKTVKSGIPEGCIAISKDEAASFTADGIDAAGTKTPDDTDTGISTHAVQLGTRVQSVIVYPLGYNMETNELFINPNIFKQVVYNTNFQQSAGIALSNSETLLLMQKMMDFMGSLGTNYALVGWHLQGVVLFGYDRPQYVLYRHSPTSLDTTTEERLDLSGSNVSVRFKGNFTFPKGVDVLKSYYYVSISGACYYKTSSGGQSDALFGISGAFNSPNPD